MLTLTATRRLRGPTTISGGSTVQLVNALADVNSSLTHRWSFDNSLADSVGRRDGHS